MMGLIKINDINMNYESFGKGWPIVLIHGAYIDSGEWVYQIPFFEKKYQVILADLPGHGGSGKLPVYTIEMMAEYTAALIEKLGVASCILCGHSLGGMAAQAVAAQYPSLVDKLILMETSYGVRSNPLEAFLTALTMPILKRVSVEKQAVMFADAMGKQSEKTKAYIAETIAKHASDHENYNRIWDATVNYDGKSSLGKIDCPTLIVAGEENKQTHHQAKVMQKSIKGSELVFVRQAGHVVNMDNPDDFNQAVLRFIQP